VASLTAMSEKHREWARMGAAGRLLEIEKERLEILAEFPELKGQFRANGAPRRTMSPETRKKMSAGMRRFWARRKAAAKSSNKPS
jgi:hypothetical protein